MADGRKLPVDAKPVEPVVAVAPDNAALLALVEQTIGQAIQAGIAAVALPPSGAVSRHFQERLAAFDPYDTEHRNLTRLAAMRMASGQGLFSASSGSRSEEMERAIEEMKKTEKRGPDGRPGA